MAAQESQPVKPEMDAKIRKLREQVAFWGPERVTRLNSSICTTCEFQLDSHLSVAQVHNWI